MNRFIVLLAIVLGIAIGTVGRHLPLTITDVLYWGDVDTSCGMEEAVDCAFRDLPDTIGQLVMFGLVLLAVTTALAVIGVAAVTYGLRRRRRTPEDLGADAGGAVSDLSDLCVLTVGVAFITPPVWVALAVAVSVVS